MKKKLLVLFVSSALFTMGFFSYSVHAETLNQLISTEAYVDVFVLITYQGTYEVICDYYPASYKYMRILPGLKIGLFDSNWNDYSNCNVFYTNDINPLNNPDYNMVGSSQSTPIGDFDSIICVKGSAVDDSNSENKYFGSVSDYDDFINPPSDPSIWELTWEGFWDTLEALGDGLEKADDTLWDWIKNFFTDENETPDYNSILVTPAPTPTPIPVTYQTVTIPDGNGGSVTTNQYVYKDENNNTIIATSIPTGGIVINLPSGNGNSGENGNGSGVNSDPSNYSPANPLQIPDLVWLNPHAFAENQDQFPLETLQNAEDFTKEASENYLTGVAGIFSLFTFIPSELYAVIGIGLSIIVIAGIMCKLLGG